MGNIMQLFILGLLSNFRSNYYSTVVCHYLNYKIRVFLNDYTVSFASYTTIEALDSRLTLAHRATY